ncbi:MAG: 5'/3'-nucleotidase SurE [Bacteroidales bacterium]
MKEMDRKPLILVTNDDGVNAKGIASLVGALKGLGEIVVVAPDGARSGQSGAISPNVPLRIESVSRESDVSVYKTNGTPVDCVKLAMSQLLDRMPALIVSGINHGSNAAVSILYSGTMGAVLEGCVRGIPSVGFSLCDFQADADFSACDHYVRHIATDVLERGLAAGVCLNVNIPALQAESLKGIRVCRQASGYWTKEYERRVNAEGEEAYWLTGYFHNLEPEASDTDEWALDRGFVSVVPCKIDMTAHQLLHEFSHLERL